MLFGNSVSGQIISKIDGNGPFCPQSNAKTVMYSIEIEEAKILHVRDEGHAFHELSPN